MTSPFFIRLELEEFHQRQSLFFLRLVLVGFHYYLPSDFFELFHFIKISMVGFVYFFVFFSLEEFFVLHT